MNLRVVGQAAGTLALTSAGAFALRWSVWGALRAVLWLTGMAHRPRAEWPFLTACALLTAGVFGLGVVAFLARRLAPGRLPAALGATLAVALLVPLALARHDHLENTDMFGYDFVRPPRKGHFPFAPDETWTIERGRREGVANSTAEGFRRCAPPDAPPSGAREIALVGDSFVFGLALDDDESPCWVLRERFAQTHPGAYRFRNLGQPGASIHSYVETTRFYDDAYGADLVVVGLLLPNDSQVIEVNTHRIVRDTWWFRTFGTLLAPFDVMEAAVAFVKIGRAELFEVVSIRQGLEDLAALAEEREIPMLWFLWDTPDEALRRGRSGAAYLAEVERVAATSPYVTSAGIIEPEPVPGERMYMVNDGHPEAAGVQAIMAWLAPRLAAWAEEAP